MQTENAVLIASRDLAQLQAATIQPPPLTMGRPDIEMAELLNPMRAVAIETSDTGPLVDHKFIRWDREERLIPAGHPAAAYVAARYGRMDWELFRQLKDDPTVMFGVPVLEVEDEEGMVLKAVRIEPRVFHKDCPAEVVNRTMVILSDLAVLRHPASVHLLKEEPAKAMEYAMPTRGAFEHNIWLRAREATDTAEAFAAFEVLFKHYSLNEELWRLDQLMKILPFDLEEHPEMEKYRALVETQIGHLRAGAKAWYAEGSPASGITIETYVKGICPIASLMPIRLHWLVNECRARGHKMVAEYGSIEGVSLFHLVQQAPDIEWHGFESNGDTVKIGHQLAADSGYASVFHLHQMGTAEAHSTRGLFDAVALFEALEHNDEREGAELLRDAEKLVHIGGTVFITTPCGNWSGWDARTQDINIRKDHINAYTPKRMLDFLTKHARAVPGTIKTERVENPSLHENNAWVHASYTLREEARP